MELAELINEWRVFEPMAIVIHIPRECFDKYEQLSLSVYDYNYAPLSIFSRELITFFVNQVMHYYHDAGGTPSQTESIEAK